MSLFRRSAVPVLPDGDFLPVAMPTTGLRALQVLIRTGQVLRRYGELESVLTGGQREAAPRVLADERTVDVHGTATRRTQLGVGLGIVSAIIQALGGEANLSLGSTTATAVEFVYSDMAVDRVDLSTLDLWLTGARFHPRLRNLAELLVADHVYVVVAVLKAKAVRMRLLDDRSYDVAVDVPAIQALLGASVTVESSRGSDTWLTISGSQSITVAAKAAQMHVDESGFWVSELPRTSGEIRSITGAQFLTGHELRVEPAWPVTPS
ncbi:hypothetical protein AMIS_40160 [Actinoplanes missouriensis 431]|uniref:Gasdermin bGSDM n=1 Tax=Actinoplanes missouriensis (strain ATCC 14538 / DSM 43046 / CBS 188.64 / JCM 3121 / NBRC 102363 / NCIMB 12654 / NRRL B-3342 / UNCC 431) TaxID=512565 RepID=I0H899_ACTM4|nr:hypothetical protein [Actinoplanes missouriensis]BAL89236.1 hypothetical protein AMIS_40160 [Actinoplanes missouriensis 431]